MFHFHITDLPPPPPLPPSLLDQLPVGSRLGISYNTGSRSMQTNGRYISSPGAHPLFPPTLSDVPLIFSHFAHREKQAILVRVVEMFEKQAVEPVLRNQQSRILQQALPSSEVKSGGSWVPVIYLSSLNKLLLIPSFKMETVE